MGDSDRNGKLGFECDVCGVFIGDIRLIKRCYRCHKDIKKNGLISIGVKKIHCLAYRSSLISYISILN